MSQEEQANEHYRIHVPHPDCEIIVGEGPSGFVGVTQRVSNGGMFFAAGGYGFGIGSVDSTYEGFRKAHTALSIGISAVQLVGQFMRALMLGRDANVLSVTVNAVAFGAGPLASAVGAITTNGLTTPEGTICMYAEKTVALASPISVNFTGGVAASLNGGVAASLNGVVSSTVNGITAGVYGSFAATVAGMQTRVVGDAESSISTRNGKVAVEGTTVQIGARSGVVPGMAYWEFTTGGQHATANVDIQADKEITISPGGELDRVTGTATKIVAHPDGVHAQGPDSALTMEDYALLRSGGSAIALTSNQMKLFVAPVSLNAAFKKAMQAAEAAWVTETKAADKIVKTIEEKGLHRVTMGMLGSIAGLAAGLATSRGSEGEKAGIVIGAQIGGGAVGALGIMGVLTAVESKLTQTAREIARKAADMKLRAASMLLRETAKAQAQALSSVPTTPSIDLTSKNVTITVGLSTIQVTPTGITLKTAPGMSVNINGQEFKNTIPGLLAVG
ncbi:MAG: hypothetical protein U0414_29260 [Polyangiaceae bacterium]